MLDDLDGRALLSRLHDYDLDSIDVGDFIDEVLDGDEPDERHIPVLNFIADDYRFGFAGYIKEGKVDAWRSVQVLGGPDVWAEHPVGADGGLGLCWSCSRDGAVPYGAGTTGGVRRVIIGRVIASEVDWAASCIINKVKPEQSEARLLPEAVVEILGFEDGTTPQNLPCPCLGQSFPAVTRDAALRPSL